MEEKEYLETLLQAAGRFFASHPPSSLRESVSCEEDLGALEGRLDPFVREVLASAGRLEDILKYARFRNPEPSVWRDASDWSDVVFRAAYLMVLEDLKGMVSRAVKGEIPVGMFPGGTD